MSTDTAGRRSSLALATLAAVAAAVLVLGFSGVHQGEAHSDGAHDDGAVATARTEKAVAFHDQMRKLWEDHITWTRLAIVSFAHDLPDLPQTQARLLRNQTDIGNAIKPFYGRRAGNRLTALLKEHITGAVNLLVAAKSGDAALIERRKAEWYRNGNEIADFLNKANPRHWKRSTMRRLMRVHLDDTLDEAVHRLGGDFRADIRDYERIHRHILRMADTLSNGIIKQFPRRFR